MKAAKTGILYRYTFLRPKVSLKGAAVMGPNAIPRVYNEYGNNETVVETPKSATTSSLARTYIVEAKVLCTSQSTAG